MMKEIDKITNRINKRKKRVDINAEIKEFDHNKSSNLYKVLMGIMTVYTIFMSFAIYARKDENATLINNVFNSDINFSSFNKVLNKLLNVRIIDNVDNDLDSSLVSANVEYFSIGNDYYTSEGNLLVAMDDGVITYVNGKDNNYTIIVEYDCGVRATYNEVNELNIFVNDRIYKEDILGSFDDQVHIIFIRNNNKVTYEEVIAII